MALKIKTRKIAGELRRAQIITSFGPGSIVDMAGYSVIMSSTKCWDTKDSEEEIHERNLEKLLGMRGFRLPHKYEADYPTEKKFPDIQAFRFPYMCFCPACHRLMPYWGFGKDKSNKCDRCKKPLVASRFVAACINGHLEDFPYGWWVHSGDYSKCPPRVHKSSLKIFFSDKSGGLESIVIKCEECGTTRSMAGCMSKAALIGYKCRGKRPWYRTGDGDIDSKECAAQMRGLQRGASNVYFSVISSALTVPPWSNRIQEVISEHRDEIEDYIALLSPDKEKAEKDFRDWCANRRAFKEKLYNPKICTVDELIEQINKDSEFSASALYSEQELLEDEYRVLCMGNYWDEARDTNFHSERTEVPVILNKYIEDVVLVKRLREVLALRGFRRISPEEGGLTSTDEQFRGYHLQKELVPLSDPERDWLPAIEMLGEGIFIRLKKEELEDWERRNGSQYIELEKRLLRGHVRCKNFSARYVLLHTLAHLLIRQLSLECGYSGAAIKERIYSTYPESDKDMCGILLYTSTSDSDGSLGGLVRKGLKDSLENIFRNLLQEASWCSSDPICIKSRAQGLESLNYAACHACTLLPETCCVMRNCLLDRAAVVGNLDTKGQGYFEDLLVNASD